MTDATKVAASVPDRCRPRRDGAIPAIAGWFADHVPHGHRAAVGGQLGDRPARATIGDDLMNPLDLAAGQAVFLVKVEADEGLNERIGGSAAVAVCTA